MALLAIRRYILALLRYGWNRMEIDEKLTNLVYQDFGDTKGGSASNNKLQAIKLPDLMGKRFLDLGCNAGFFCVHAKSSGASYVLGVDSSPRVIGIARERHPDIDFLDTGWDKFPDGEFDVVICLSAIHYAADAVALASNIHSHLSTDGLFVLEGGVVREDILPWTDLLVVAWREVGDRVRHLSSGFIERHLLTGFDWKLISESIAQGGDMIPRAVIHAYKRANSTPVAKRPDHRICLLEYAQALAISAPAIQPSLPSYEYVKALGDLPTPIDASSLEVALQSDSRFETFIADLVYALGKHNSTLEVKSSVSDAMLQRFKEALAANNVEIRAVPGQTT